MFVAQLVEQSLSTPEVRSSNPHDGKINFDYCLLSTALKGRKKEVAGNGTWDYFYYSINTVNKTNRKKKRSGMVYFFKKNFIFQYLTDGVLFTFGLYFDGRFEPPAV